MITASVPILSKLKQSGGTFYTFSSTVNDFSYMFSDSDIRLAPSKFVAMKLPNWKNITGQSMFMNPNNIGSPNITEPNSVFPKILQNYTENLIQYTEALRTDNTLLNYAESSWWKTLRMLGAMEVVDSGKTVIESGITKKLFREKEKSTTYEPIIKFVGDVNMINHAKSQGNEFIEMFTNIPTKKGRMDGVLFKKGDMEFPSGLIPLGGGDDFSLGLEDNYVNNTDNAKAIYDNTITRQYEVGSEIQDIGLYFDDIINDSTKQDKGDFEFNAIALYYDVYDKNDKTIKNTNLYGIYFLEDFNSQTGGVGVIDTFKIYQPTEDTNGNGYSLRMNLKFANSTNHVTSEITVNDYSTVSMELYMEALNRLKKITDITEKMMSTVTNIKKENDRLVQTSLQKDKILATIQMIENNSDRLKILETGQKVGAMSSVRITNEELFQAFSKTINSLNTTDKNVKIENIISKRSYLGKLVDLEQNIIEFTDGSRYKWDISLNDWVLI